MWTQCESQSLSLRQHIQQVHCQFRAFRSLCFFLLLRVRLNRPLVPAVHLFVCRVGPTGSHLKGAETKIVAHVAKTEQE